MDESDSYRRVRPAIRWTVRSMILALTLFLLIGGPLPDYAARLIPALSPLSVLSASLAHRAWYVSLAWSLPAWLVFGLALWKGRFFCRWICPLGTLYSIPSQFSRKKRFFPWRLNGVVFWFTVSAALAGLPLILFLDPLSTFMRIGALRCGGTYPAAWIPGVLIPLFLLLGLLQPHIWCAQLCPLGYLVEKLKIGAAKSERAVSRGRRELLAGIALGVPFALLFRHAARAGEEELPVLPPGARDLDNFAATCIRCYACVKVCPTGVLTVRNQRGVAELCIPEMDFIRTDGAYCEQYCNACSQVCPTGAIRWLSMEEKQQRKVATASIIREACLAWEERQECMACDEFCGYNAIEASIGSDGVPKPMVNPRKCRGCGACQNICPAIRAGNAVSIKPVSAQTVITEEDDNSTLGNNPCHPGRH